MRDLSPDLFEVSEGRIDRFLFFLIYRRCFWGLFRLSRRPYGQVHWSSRALRDCGANAYEPA
jgi:hypothetical protein